MAIRVRCPKCGHSSEVDARPGETVKCPGCGRRLFLKPPDAPAQHAAPAGVEREGEPAEPSPWRNPAIWISLAAILALVVVFLAITLREPELPPPPRDSARPPAAARAEPEPEKPSPPAQKAALSAEEVFKRVSPAVVRVKVFGRDFKQIGLGSGFFVKANGLLVTNYHVVRDAAFATVLRTDGTMFFVDKIVSLDKRNDLAVLKVSGTDLAHLEIVPADADPAVGARVYAIGHPRRLTNTLSEGVVSGVRMVGEGSWRVQTTAAISLGSSGGPLVDAKGRVVGVTSVFLLEGQNLNFAVPAEAIRAAIEKPPATAQGAPTESGPLASAGGKPLSPKVASELNKVWAAIEEERWDDAFRIIRTLNMRNPENPFVWFALGYLYTELGNYKLAVQAYKTAIRLYPENAYAYINLGEAYIEMGRYADAVKACKTAIRLYPEDADAYYNLGVAYGEMGRHADAVQAYKIAIRLYPEDAAHAYINLGEAYGEMGRHADAVQAYKTAIRLDPEDADAYYNLGEAYAEMGRHADALRVYRTLRQLDPKMAEELHSHIYGE